MNRPTVSITMAQSTTYDSCMLKFKFLKFLELVMPTVNNPSNFLGKYKRIRGTSMSKGNR